MNKHFLRDNSVGYEVQYGTIIGYKVMHDEDGKLKSKTFTIKDSKSSAFYYTRTFNFRSEDKRDSWERNVRVFFLDDVNGDETKILGTKVLYSRNNRGKVDKIGIPVAGRVQYINFDGMDVYFSISEDSRIR